MPLMPNTLADALASIGEKKTVEDAADAWFEAWFTYAKNMVLLTLAGVETPEAGSALRQKVLFARREDIPLEKGQYFLQDLLGCEVRDADTGKPYGKLCDITETGANRVYHIRFADGKVRLAPDIPQVVLRLAPEEGVIEIRPLAGLFDDVTEDDYEV